MSVQRRRGELIDRALADVLRARPKPQPEPRKAYLLAGRKRRYVQIHAVDTDVPQKVGEDTLRA